MEKGKKAGKNYRMIHTRLSAEDHKRLRISAAEMDTTMQGWVERAIVEELARQDRKRGRYNG